MVNRLEKIDVLVRTRDENDRRIVRVGLSDEYQKKALEHSDCFEKFANDLFSKVSPDEIDTILDGLIILDKLFEMKIENKKGGPSA
jgi:DNA-binding MarR family transcriptional regulator